MGHPGAGLRWAEALLVTSPGRVGAEAPIFLKFGTSVVLCFILSFLISTWSISQEAPAPKRTLLLGSACSQL